MRFRSANHTGFEWSLVAPNMRVMQLSKGDVSAGIKRIRTGQKVWSLCFELIMERGSN
jgi:hypothetical protein